MKTTSTETFKQNATVKHEGFYTYDKAVWVSNKTKLVITCPVHGDFEQTKNVVVNYYNLVTQSYLTKTVFLC